MVRWCQLVFWWWTKQERSIVARAFIEYFSLGMPLTQFDVGLDLIGEKAMLPVNW